MLLVDALRAVRRPVLAVLAGLLAWSGAWAVPAGAQANGNALVERERVLDAAERYLNAAPVTITAFPVERSAGGEHSAAGDDTSGFTGMIWSFNLAFPLEAVR